LIGSKEFVSIISKSFQFSTNPVINDYLSILLLDLNDNFLSHKNKKKLYNLQIILYNHILIETIQTTDKLNTKDFYKLFVDIIKKVLFS